MAKRKRGHNLNWSEGALQLRKTKCLFFFLHFPQSILEKVHAKFSRKAFTSTAKKKKKRSSFSLTVSFYRLLTISYALILL